jgi:hypothetical protein
VNAPLTASSTDETGTARRMLSVATAAAVVAIAGGAFDLLAPLWVVDGLGLGADDWARWRSWRMGGTCGGILLLGLLAERWGARRMALASSGLAGLALALLASGGGRMAGPLMAGFGAGASGIFVALNLLTQDVSAMRQGTANALYRSVSAAAGVAAPVIGLACAAATGSLAGGLACIAGLVALTGLAVLPYRSRPRPVRPWSDTLHAYRRALANRDLRALLLVEHGFSSLLAVVATFAAIRFTGPLAWSRADFAALVSLTGLGLALGVAGCGALIRRCGCRRLLVGLYAAVVIGALVLGLVPGRAPAAFGFLLVTVGLGMGSAPSSLWIHRCAKGAPAAFVVAKLVQAGQLMLVTLAAAWLEPRIGIPGLWLGAAVLGTLLLPALGRLREPVA